MKIAKILLIAPLSTIAIFALLYILTRGEVERTYTAVHRSNYYSLCRKNDAVVLDSSMFLPQGVLYVFSKNKKGEFKLVQYIDLTEYLKGYYIPFIEEIHKGATEKFFDDCPIAFNDHYIIVLASDEKTRTAVKDNRGSAFVFKKNDDQFVYFGRIDNVGTHQVVLTEDDQAIMSDVRIIKDTDRSKLDYYYNNDCLHSYELTNIQIKKGNAISLPPLVKNYYGKQIKTSDSNAMIKDWFFVSGNNLIVEVMVNIKTVLSDEDYSNLSENEKNTAVTTYFLYRVVDREWVFQQSMTELIPGTFYTRSENRTLNRTILDPFRNVTKIDLDQRALQISFIDHIAGEKTLIECIFNTETELFELNHIVSKQYIIENSKNIFKTDKNKGNVDSYDDATRINLVVQSRNNYNLCVINKSTELGIALPSQATNPDIVSPNWIIPSGDKQTMDLLVEYYKNNLVADFVWDFGYSSFYEFTNYIPVLHYSIYDDNMVVTYVFPDCFFKGSPMQRPDIVWAGVDFYKLDPERGPIKTSSFTTSNLEPLKEVPVVNP